MIVTITKELIDEAIDDSINRKVTICETCLLARLYRIKYPGARVGFSYMGDGIHMDTVTTLEERKLINIFDENYYKEEGRATLYGLIGTQLQLQEL